MSHVCVRVSLVDHPPERAGLDNLVLLRVQVGVKVGQVYPAGIATPWWDDPARGGHKEKPDTSNFLSADDVASAIMTLVTQPAGSDIDKLVLRGANNVQR